MKKLPSLVASLALAYAAAALGSFYTATAVRTWYATLAKSSLNPPDWVFAPMWTTLYALMAVAAWRVWEGRAARPRAAAQALVLYGAQLLLNVCWSFVFFGEHDPARGLVVIGLLLLTIIGTTILFFRRDRLAGWLFVPYLAWVLFASYLNLAVVLLNP